MSRPLHMRHNFPAIEALEAGRIDPAALSTIAPGVDPERLLVREAHPWFERFVLRTSAALALPYVVYVHSRAYRQPREANTRLIVHELVHVSQWKEEGYVRFATRYLSDYLRGRMRGRSHTEAYRAIRYEVEARAAADSILSSQGPSQG